MKRQLIRPVSAIVLSICALTGLSGCSKDFNAHKWVAEYPGDQRPKFSEADNQRRIAEQRKSEEEIKAAYAARMKDTQAKISSDKNEPDDITLPDDAYGSNIAGTPSTFVRLSPQEKAALHWAAAQEYRKAHSVTSLNYKEAVPLSEIHGITEAALMEQGWENPKEINKIINALPFQPKSYEKWRAKTIEKHNTTQGLLNAVAALDQRQKEEQLNSSLNRHGCEWMTGKYYIDSNPTSLCTPVIGKCVEGNCDNGHGTYISFDGSKFVGEFKDGAPFMKDSIYGYSKCLKGNCTNGHGTYTFRDGTQYVGDFKNSKPDGQGTKIWAIGLSYTGEFKDGIDTGKGKYTWPAKHNLTQATCLEGDCNNGPGVIMYENDTKYVGHFKSGTPHGKGIYYWRTGEALDGEFENGWLKPGGHHISPEGNIVVQKERRGWLKTYAEEKSAAIAKANEEDGKRFVREMLLRGIIQSFEGSKIDCSEYHALGTAEWYKCGGN